jgi:ubiquinone/menaquinone biosynthesis C-methylase UbiE
VNHVIYRLLTVILLLAVSTGCGDIKRSLYEGFQRDGWQQAERVILALGIRSGEHIADLGAGGGYFTFRLADATGSDGNVYGVDVDEEMVEYLETKTQAEGYANIETIVAKYDDPMLPEHGVDLIFTCNTYHHIENRVAYFEHVKKYLSAKGRIAIIDFEGKTWFLRLLGHITPAAEIQSDMEAAGYRLVQEFDFLPKQNFQIFMMQ